MNKERAELETRNSLYARISQVVGSQLAEIEDFEDEEFEE